MRLQCNIGQSFAQIVSFKKVYMIQMATDNTLNNNNNTLLFFAYQSYPLKIFLCLIRQE